LTVDVDGSEIHDHDAENLSAHDVLNAGRVGCANFVPVGSRHTQVEPRLAFSNPRLAKSTSNHIRVILLPQLSSGRQRIEAHVAGRKNWSTVCSGLNATFLNQGSDAFKDLRHQIVDNHVGA